MPSTQQAPNYYQQRLHEENQERLKELEKGQDALRNGQADLRVEFEKSTSDLREDFALYKGELKGTIRLVGAILALIQIILQLLLHK